MSDTISPKAPSGMVDISLPWRERILSVLRPVKVPGGMQAILL